MQAQRGHQAFWRPRFFIMIEIDIMFLLQALLLQMIGWHVGKFSNEWVDKMKLPIKENLLRNAVQTTCFPIFKLG